RASRCGSGWRGVQRSACAGESCAGSGVRGRQRDVSAHAPSGRRGGGILSRGRGLLTAVAAGTGTGWRRGGVEALEFLQGAEVVGEFAERRVDAHLSLVRAGRGAGPGRAGWDVGHAAGIGADGRRRADAEVVGDADVAGDDDPVLDDDGAGDAGEAADDDVPADGAVVADLAEVVDLRAVADGGGAELAAV